MHPFPTQPLWLMVHSRHCRTLPAAMPWLVRRRSLRAWPQHRPATRSWRQTWLKHMPRCGHASLQQRCLCGQAVRLNAVAAKKNSSGSAAGLLMADLLHVLCMAAGHVSVPDDSRPGAAAGGSTDGIEPGGVCQRDTHAGTAARCDHWTTVMPCTTQMGHCCRDIVVWQTTCCPWQAWVVHA